MLEAYSDSLFEAAHVLVDSSLRNSEQPGLRELELLRTLSFTDVRRLAHPQRKLLLAGMLMARIRADDNVAALELAEVTGERGFNRLLTPDPASEFHALEAALAEVYLATGYSTKAVLHAHRLLESVEEGASPAWELRTYGICAAAHAIDGDHRTAQSFLDRVARLKAQQGWPSDQVEFMDAIAEIVIAFTSMDGARIRLLRDATTRLPEREPTALSLVHLIQALALFADGDVTGTLAGSAIVAHGSDLPTGPSFIRMCALAIEAIVLIQRGTPAQALALLHDVPALHDHYVCFDVVRASAFILMGDYRAALQVTDGCMRERATHSRWMMPATLLRRAIANMRLGNTEEAAKDGVDALGFVESVSPQLGLIMLPTRDLLSLGVRIFAEQPRLLPRLGKLQQDIRRLPKFITPSFPLPSLSPRERIIAIQLRGDKSYAELAADLHVSPSTVKSQANAVAKKLGAHTREEAVERLEQSGFYTIYGETPAA